MAVFEDTPTETTSALESLVGEGKKFQTPEDLAKGKLEADNYIATLIAERDQAKAEAAARKTVEEQLKALKSAQPNPSTDQSKVEDTGKVSLTDDELMQRIKAVTESVRQEDVVRSNVQTVADKLVEIYGSEEKANEVVKAKAKELGVSVKFLQSTAAQSPTAFFATLGVNSSPSRATPTRSDVNTESFVRRSDSTNAVPGTYEALKQSAGNDVKKLMDPAYLQAAHDAAMKDPAKFFGPRWNA